MSLTQLQAQPQPAPAMQPPQGAPAPPITPPQTPPIISPPSPTTDQAGTVTHNASSIPSALSGTIQDPKKNVSVYLELHEKFLKEAEEEYAKGDLVQASEKLWGSVASLLNAIAEVRGWEHSSHRDYQIIVENLFKETGDRELSICFDAAEKLHANFYHNFLSKDGFEARRDCVFKLINKLKEFVNIV
ncbi:MAG: PaREP1 family protein [Vulcanisaeta sp.]|nr:PaREP1 family protein [Vulcanisaeta sp.]